VGTVVYASRMRTVTHFLKRQARSKAKAGRQVQESRGDPASEEGGCELEGADESAPFPASKLLYDTPRERDIGQAAHLQGKDRTPEGYSSIVLNL
jgi:hypothetical protein